MGLSIRAAYHDSAVTFILTGPDIGPKAVQIGDSLIGEICAVGPKRWEMTAGQDWSCTAESDTPADAWARLLERWLIRSSIMAQAGQDTKQSKQWSTVQ